MNKIREIQRLHEAGLSNRQIERTLKISRTIIAQYLSDFKSSGVTYTDMKVMSDSAFLELLEKRKRESTEKYKQLSDYFEYFAKEVKKKGVTLQLLWEEYKEKHPEGYSRTQFYHHFQVWRGVSDVTMHIEHKAGDKMFVDFAGTKLIVTNRDTGKERGVETFVAILGGSGYTYTIATETQKKEDWIKANEHALWYFEGVPNAIVPDCLKSAVTKGDKYEPDINPEYTDFARHYDTVILPSSPYKKKDKALVENAVRLIYIRVYAPLRNRTFYSLEELNEAIWEKLEEHNNKQFQRLNVSRHELFEEIEKPALKTLPQAKYEFKKYLNLKVQFNYHIELREDRHYYSVPWQYKGKRVNVLYTEQTVEIYHENIRISFHRRDRTRNGYTTLREHMPPHHQFYDDWSPQRIINWAEKIGGDVKTMVTKVLEKRQHPEQGFKVCLGIINLAKKYGDIRLDRACRRALEFQYYSYKAIKNILENGLDKMQEESLFPEPLPLHENIRGSVYYS